MSQNFEETRMHGNNRGSACSPEHLASDWADPVFLKGCDRRVPPAASERGALCLYSGAPRHRLPRVLALRLHSSPAILPVAPGGGALGGSHTRLALRDRPRSLPARPPSCSRPPCVANDGPEYRIILPPRWPKSRSRSPSKWKSNRRKTSVRRLQRQSLVSRWCPRGVG